MSLLLAKFVLHRPVKGRGTMRTIIFAFAPMTKQLNAQIYLTKYHARNPQIFVFGHLLLSVPKETYIPLARKLNAKS